MAIIEEIYFCEKKIGPREVDFRIGKYTIRQKMWVERW